MDSSRFAKQLSSHTLERLSRCSREDHPGDSEGRFRRYHTERERMEQERTAMKDLGTALKGLALVLRYQADDGATVRWVEKRLHQLSRKAERMGKA